MDNGLTSLYETTTYHNGGKISSRKHRELDFSKMTNAYVIGALVLILAIAAIPFLILLPLLFYIIQPMRALRGTNPDFENSILKNNGFNKLSNFNLKVKIKTIFLLCILLFSAILVDYFVFSGMGKTNNLFDLQLKYSIYLFAFYLILPFFITRERILVKIITNKKNFNLFEKLYIDKANTDENLMKQYFINKKFRNIFLSYMAAYPLVLCILIIGETIIGEEFYSIFSFYYDIDLPRIISFTEYWDLGYLNFIYNLNVLEFHLLVLASFIFYYLIKWVITLKRTYKIRKEKK